MRPPSDMNPAWRLARLGLSLMIMGVPLMGAPEDSNPQPATPSSVSDLSALMPVWNRFYSVSAGVGYKDNLLLGPSQRELGGFSHLSGDIILWRRPLEDRREFHGLLNGSYRRYWANRSVEHESDVFLLTRQVHPFAESWDLVAELEGAYFDQVIDATLVDTVIQRQQLRGALVRVQPGILWRAGDRSSLQMGPMASRLWLASPFDHHAEYGAALTWAQSYGRRSEWKLEFSSRRRVYDSLTASSLAGAPIAGVTRAYHRHALNFSGRHYWDARRRWSTQTRLAPEAGLDDGPGYWSYQRIRVQQGIQWSASLWDARAELAWMHDGFDQQTISTPAGRARTRNELTGTARLERRFGEFLRIFVEYRHEQSMASDPLERFVANTYSAGCLWEF